jgi:hypothetical protein
MATMGLLSELGWAEACLQFHRCLTSLAMTLPDIHGWLAGAHRSGTLDLQSVNEPPAIISL